MKKVWVCLIFLISSYASFAQARTMRDLLGSWDVVDSDNSRGLLEVSDSNTIYLAFQGQRKQITSYKADFSKSPGSFAFAIKDSSGTVNLNSQILFVNDNLVEWRIFEADVKQVADSKDKGVLYLRRRK